MTWTAALPCCDDTGPDLPPAVEKIVHEAWMAQPKGDDARPWKASELRAFAAAVRKDLDAEIALLRERIAELSS